MFLRKIKFFSFIVSDIWDEFFKSGWIESMKLLEDYLASLLKETLDLFVSAGLFISLFLLNSLKIIFILKIVEVFDIFVASNNIHLNVELSFVY